MIFAQSKEAIFFGGACDNVDRLGLLDEPYGQFKQSVDTLRSRGWNADLEFGSASSKALLLQKLDQAVISAEKGELKQLLIGTLTHGRPSTQDHAHSFCIGGDEKEKWMEANDRDFIAKLERLKNLGVNIGIIDGSCFSGGSLKPLKKYGCIISAQSSNRPTWGSGPFEAINRSPKKNELSLSDVWRDNLINDSYANAGYMTMPSNSEQDNIQNVQDDITKILLNVSWTKSAERKQVESCQNNAELTAKHLDELLESFKKISANMLETDYSNFMGEQTDYPKTFQNLKNIISEDLLTMQKKIETAKSLGDEIMNIDKKETKEQKSISEGFMKNLSADEKKKLQSILSWNFGIHLDFKNGYAQVDLVRLANMSQKIDMYKQDEQLLQNEGMRKEIILKNASALLDSVSGNEVKNAAFKIQQRQALVTKLMALQDELGESNAEGSEKNLLMNRLAKNTKFLMAFLSKYKETYSGKDNCSNFML